MTDLMRHQKHSVTRRRRCLTADCSTLLVKQRSRALEDRIPLGHIGQFEVQMVDCGCDESYRIDRIAPDRQDRLVELRGSDANRLKTIHGLKTQEMPLLFVRQARTSHGISEALAPTLLGATVGLVELAAFLCSRLAGLQVRGQHFDRYLECVRYASLETVRNCVWID